MLSWLSSRNSDAGTAAKLYGTVVAQARQPAFYAECGIADTPEGRYELIVLHLALVLDRLQRAGEPAARLARALVETFVTDMDDSMREMGVGDLTVPKKVKRAAGGLYDRTDQYRRALADSGADALQAALRETLPGLSAGAIPSLARYVRCAAQSLHMLPLDAIASGTLAFPNADVKDSRHG